MHACMLSTCSDRSASPRRLDLPLSRKNPRRGSGCSVGSIDSVHSTRHSLFLNWTATSVPLRASALASASAAIPVPPAPLPPCRRVCDPYCAARCCGLTGRYPSGGAATNSAEIACCLHACMLSSCCLHAMLQASPVPSWGLSSCHRLRSRLRARRWRRCSAPAGPLPPARQLRHHIIT